MNPSVAPALNAEPVVKPNLPRARVISIDALRGLVMFTMIFVNDLAGAPAALVPAWMRHYHGKSGMTFVDLVFPAFLFIVGMAIPFALGSRLNRGEPLGRTVCHILSRTGALLCIGILMVHETPDSGQLGWPGVAWCTLMYLAAICAFGSVSPNPATIAPNIKGSVARTSSVVLRIAGWLGLVWLALSFRGNQGQRILTLSPLALHTSWYGILGLIGWAYLVSSLVFLLFRGNRTALLGCVVLLFCLYPADKTGAFSDFWLSRYVRIGGMFGSHGGIAAAGVLLGSLLVHPDTSSPYSILKFSLLFIGGCAAGALLVQGLYGINKNSATPSWCLWACAITGTLWLLFHLFGEARPEHQAPAFLKVLAIAGENVLLAYLLSEMLPSLLEWVGLDGSYGRLAEGHLAGAIARSGGCAVVVLGITALLNRVGFRLKL